MEDAPAALQIQNQIQNYTGGGCAPDFPPVPKNIPMSNQKNIATFKNICIVLGLAFFIWIAKADYTNADYSNIKDSNYNCKAILEEVDRVGFTKYILNGVNDSGQHTYTKKENARIRAEKARIRQNYYQQPQQQQNQQPTDGNGWQQVFTAQEWEYLTPEQQRNVIAQYNGNR